MWKQMITTEEPYCNRTNSNFTRFRWMWQLRATMKCPGENTQPYNCCDIVLPATHAASSSPKLKSSENIEAHLWPHATFGGEESLSDVDEAHRFDGNPETKNLMKTKRIRDSKLSSKSAPSEKKMPSHAYVSSGRRVESKPHSKPSGSGFTA